MMASAGNSLFRSRLKLSLLALVFVAPVAAAYITFYAIGPSGPSATTNHGHLVDPARPLFDYPQATEPGTASGPPVPKPFLATAGLRAPGTGPASPAAVFRSQWTLLYIARARCNDACRQRLYDTRQVRTATGRRRERIRRVLLMIDPADMSALRSFLTRMHPGLKLVIGHSPAAADLVRFFSPAGGESAATVIGADRVYLIDPLGNWFMYYLPGEPAKGILEDLHKVMRASFIG